jgi:hypothetical protein
MHKTAESEHGRWSAALAGLSPCAAVASALATGGRRVPHKVLKAADIQLIRLDNQHITRPPGQQLIAGRGTPAPSALRSRDTWACRQASADGGAPASPGLLDQHVGRYHRARPGQQNSQQRTHIPAIKPHRATAELPGRRSEPRVARKLASRFRWAVAVLSTRATPALPAAGGGIDGLQTDCGRLLPD